jgi:hypothetical protein
MQTAIAVCILFSQGTFAQPDTLWTRSYRLGGNPVCHRLAHTSDGGFALGIQTDTDNNDWGLIKVDSMGRREWSRTYRSNDTLGNLHDVLQGLAVADNDFYLAGYWNRDFARLMRVDSEGQEVWSNNYPDQNNYFYDVVVGRDGYPVCSGVTAQGGIDALLMKVDQRGGVVWQRAYGGRGTDDFVRVINTSDEGLLAVGSTTSFGGMKAYAVKTDSDGNQAWARTFNANRENHAFMSTIESPEGGYGSRKRPNQ